MKKQRKRLSEKLDCPTAEEILEDARKKARPLSPGERRKVERLGQQNLPEYSAWPNLMKY